MGEDPRTDFAEDIVRGDLAEKGQDTGFWDAGLLGDFGDGDTGRVDWDHECDFFLHDPSHRYHHVELVLAALVVGRRKYLE